MCFGTLMKYRAQGDTIFIALSTSGNIGSNCHASREEIAAIREKEQLQAAAPLEAKVKFLRFDDEELRDTPETRNAFLNAIRWANPDVILTHSPADTSTDHAATSKLITEVLLVVGAKLVPTDVYKRQGQNYADRCTHQNIKKRVFIAHPNVGVIKANPVPGPGNLLWP